MPHKIDGVDLDSQLAYAEGLRCPGAKQETFDKPNPHLGRTHIAYSGSGLWGCTGCSRSFNSRELLPAQATLYAERERQAAEDAARAQRRARR